MAALRVQVLDAARPLSESIMWRAQDRYYDRVAQDAWASGDVPHTLTTGPLLARADARLIEAFARDCLAGAMGPIDPREPLYVLELGAGSGRLAFELLLALDRREIAPLQLTYVLTDRVAENVATFSEHDRLRPLIARGEVDVAHYIAGSDDVIHLEHRNQPLAKLANPLIVVANYLFDVIPQDLFTTEGGELAEELVATVSEMPAPELGDQDFFRRIFLATSRRAIADDRYGGGAIDELLRAHAKRRPEGRFLFPADALRTTRHLLELSGGRTLFLIGERPGQVPLRTPASSEVAAAIRADPTVRQGPAAVPHGDDEGHRPGALLAMGVHGGSMSLPVDLAVLAQAAAPVTTLLPEAPPAALLVAGLVFGERSPAMALRRAYRRSVREVGPEDLYLLVKAAFGAGDEGVTHAMRLAVLRAGGYDPYLLRVAGDGFTKDDEALDDAELAELARVLRRTYEHEFPIDDGDLAYGIAAVLAPAGGFAAALEFFTRSAARTGPRANTAYNVALCHLNLGDVDAAEAALREAIRLDGSYEPAHELLEQVVDERARDEARRSAAQP